MYATIELADSASEHFAASADNLLQDLVSGAGRLLGAPHGVLPRGEPTVTWIGIQSPLVFVARRDGRIVRRPFAARGDTASAALFAKVLESDPSEAAILDWSADAGRDSVTVRVTFHSPDVDESGAVHSMPLKRIGLPVFSVSVPRIHPASIKPNHPRPHFTSEMAQDGFEATVVMQFLIDTTGHVDPASIHDVWPDNKPRPEGIYLQEYDKFVEATRRALVQYEFEPARVGECKIRTMGEMSFVYKLNFRDR